MYMCMHAHIGKHIHADYADALALLTNTPAEMQGLLHSLEQTARSNGLYKISDETELMCLKQGGVIYTLNYKLWN